MYVTRFTLFIKMSSSSYVSPIRLCFGCLIQLQEPTLGSILSQQSPCFVDEGDSVTSAAIAIAKEKKAVRYT